MHGVALVRAALALRADVLRYLGGSDVASSVARFDAASADAWRFLLRVESCALPLASARLVEAEARELQRVLAARLIVRELDDVARDAGVRLTLLKGAAIAAAPARQPLDLGDVDVLTDPASAPAVWRALLARGWSPATRGVQPAEDLGARLHYAPLRSQRHELPLELHVTADYRRGASSAPPTQVGPIAGVRALDRLVPRDALAAALQHSVVAHPHRRGHLRDLFLLADLLDDVDANALEQLDRDLARDGCGVESRAMLAQARSLSRREPIVDDATLRPFVAWKYATTAQTMRLFAIKAPGWVPMTYVPLERAAVRRAEYRRLLAGVTGPLPVESSLGAGRWLGAGPARRLGLPRVLRGAYRLWLVSCLFSVGGVIRRHVRSLDQRTKGVD